MALAWTYNTLHAAMLSWPREDANSEEYLADLPTIIASGHLRLVRDLNLDIFDSVDETSSTIAAGARLVTKPTTLIQTRSLRLGQIIASVAPAAADDDGICTAQEAPGTEDDLSLNGAAVTAGSVTYAPARRVTVKENTLNEGGIEVSITGTDRNGFPCNETLTTPGQGGLATSVELFSTVTAVTARFGDGTRTVSVGSAYARGTLLIGDTWPLELRSKAYCQEYAPDRRAVGRSRYFNEHSDTQWEFVEGADQAYAVIVHMVARPQELSASSPTVTTWLSRAVPDALQSACLAEAEHYLKADDRYGDVMTKYTNEQLPAARLELRNSIRLGDRGPFAGMPRPA